MTPELSRTSRPGYRLLLVDDDPMILRALRRDLQSEEHRWHIDYMNGGAEALNRLTKESYDVLVTDMVMPGIDGAELLHKARLLCPAMGRIVLSGHSDFDHAVASVPFAHQRLLKPWNRDELVAVIERTCALRDFASDELVRRTIGRVGALPSSTRVYLSLALELDKPSATFASIAAIVEQDMAMSAKLLQLANSAFVGSRRDIVSVSDAVRMVGLKELRHYLLSPFLDVFDVFAVANESHEQLFLELGKHGLFVAHLARALAPSAGVAASAFVAGLMHDLGKVVLLSHHPEAIDEIAHQAQGSSALQLELERARFGANHADIGGHLIGLWGLPVDVVEAVKNHHETLQPRSQLERTLSLANWLAHEHVERTARGLTDPNVVATEADQEWLNSLPPLAGLLRITEMTSEDLRRGERS